MTKTAVRRAKMTTKIAVSVDEAVLSLSEHIVFFEKALEGCQSEEERKPIALKLEGLQVSLKLLLEEALDVLDSHPVKV